MIFITYMYYVLFSFIKNIQVWINSIIFIPNELQYRRYLTLICFIFRFWVQFGMVEKVTRMIKGTEHN